MEKVTLQKNFVCGKPTMKKILRQERKNNVINSDTCVDGERK